MNIGPSDVVNEAVGAGRWFPGRERELAAMVDDYIADADVPDVSGRIVGAIAPHAGYIYSGRVAGHTFRAIRDNVGKGYVPGVVVVLGFSHRLGFGGVALMAGKAIRTPLGELELDRDAGGVLVESSSRIEFNSSPHMGEHSAENEIPFIQTALPGSKIVVGLMGDHDEETVRELVDGLAGLATEKQVLLIASTDMLHDADYDLVSDTDHATLHQVESMDIAGIQSSWSYSRQVFCGIGPVLAVMRFSKARGCKRGDVLYYCNSGDDYPESCGNWVVGYGSAVFAVTD